MSKRRHDATAPWTFATFASILALAASAACSSAPYGADELEGNAGGRGPGGAAGDGGTKITARGLPCAVDQVLEKRCRQCHGASTSAGASTSLVSYDDLHKQHAGKDVFRLVGERIRDQARPMPPGDPLPPAELSALTGWIDGGAQRSNDSCSTETTPKAPPACPNPDTEVRATAPYAMGAKTDEYVCFRFDVQRTQRRQVVSMSPIIDNPKILHHILVFTTDDAAAAKVPTTPTPCEAFGSKDWTLVTGWAPGGKDIVFPAEAGLPEESGTTHYVMQLHYNNAAGLTGQQDRSGFGLCTTENTRPNDVGLLAFGSMKFSIPPRGTLTHTCTYKLDDRFTGKRVFGSTPHMHKNGRGMKVERLPGGTGTPEVLVDAQGFDFEHQSGYPVSVTLQGGDVIRTTCKWQNTTDTAATFGENTGDEMCYAFTGYYPRIPDKYGEIPLYGRVPLFNWTTPANNLDIFAGIAKIARVETPKCTDAP